MAVRRGKKRAAKKRWLANAVRSHTRRLREAPAPPAAPAQAATERAKPPLLSKDLVEEPQADEFNNLPPVMLVITVLAVLFISVIAWFVAQMPAK